MEDLLQVRKAFHQGSWLTNKLLRILKYYSTFVVAVRNFSLCIRVQETVACNCANLMHGDKCE